VPKGFFLTHSQKFQSLVGFKINWNDPVDALFPGLAGVSIPSRV